MLAAFVNGVLMAVLLIWIVYEAIHRALDPTEIDAPLMLWVAIAGLAAITPASGYVGPMGALFIGAVAGVLCQFAVEVIRNRLKLDDTLDVFAVHGVGGIFGVIMAPLLATAPLTEGQGVATQLIALAAVGAFTLVGTAILARLTALIYPIRVSEEEEVIGLDLTAHGERAYDIAS